MSLRLIGRGRNNFFWGRREGMGDDWTLNMEDVH